MPGAILVNPYSNRQMDTAIDQALVMPKVEQKLLMQPMYEALCCYDVQQWANHLFREARARSANFDARSAEKIPALVQGSVAKTIGY
ncbi:MAG: trehalose-6-phosphate synthase [Cyanobacteria bacterium P01_A01_bin.123]